MSYDQSAPVFNVSNRAGGVKKEWRGAWLPLGERRRSAKIMHHPSRGHV
jgi:hypothetical protein